MLNQKQLLQAASLHNYLNQEELEILLNRSKIFSFASGDIILHQGEKISGIYIILNGMVTVKAKLLSEGVTNLETLGPGDFIGEISFIDKIPATTSAVATGPVECLFMSTLYIDMLTTYFPDAKYKLFKVISAQVCSRIKKIHDKIIEIIAHADMVTYSIFSEIIHSLTQPTVIPLDKPYTNLIFQQLSKLFNEQELKELIQHATLFTSSKHCTLIHKDEKEVACYIVIYGAVQSSIMHANKAAKLSVIGPATLFTSTTCIETKSPFTITFATCEQTIFLKISNNDLTYFQQQKLNLWYKLFDLICKSLIALEKSVDKLDIRLHIETYNR